MLPMKSIATKKNPMRMSAIDMFVRCPMKYYLEQAGVYEDRGGKAAQTGSAVHDMAQEFHVKGGNPEEIAKEIERLFGEDEPVEVGHAEASQLRLVK